MLQINMQPYASDALEDAMRLAQTKALNSYSFSDCLNYLNYAWMDMYQQIALVDEGYYSKTIRLTKKLTKLPLCVKNSIKVYAAQSPNMFNREIFRASGYNDLNGWNTYHISGFDLYCPDAERRAVWLNYVPQQPQLFFTRDNRDPKIYQDWQNMPVKEIGRNIYNLYEIFFNIVQSGGVLLNLTGNQTLNVRIIFHYRNEAQLVPDVDCTDVFYRKDWTIVSFISDFPYIFVTYKHDITGEYYSGFYHHLPENNEFIEYNPFAFTGRNSNVEYIKAKWNDKTGLGVIIKDHNDLAMFHNPAYNPELPDGPDNPRETMQPVVKELGWTPDTLLIYPAPEMYRLLVARLADKFAALNESELKGITKELVEAEFAFKNFLGKDKSSWQRIDNVNGPSIGDWL